MKRKISKGERHLPNAAPNGTQSYKQIVMKSLVFNTFKKIIQYTKMLCQTVFGKSFF
jgi:hypothetical protein